MAERKKTTRSKSSSTGSKKNTTRTSAANRTKKNSASKSSRRSPARRRTPFLVLTLMALGIAVLFLLNDRMRDKGRPAVNLRSYIAGIGDGHDKSAEDVKSDKGVSQSEIVDRGPDKAVELKMIRVKLYFLIVQEESGKVHLTPAWRMVPENQKVEQTIKSLVMGPEKREQDKGLLSALPPGLVLHSARVSGRSVVLNFNTELERGAAGSILLSRIDQIVYTATQFDNIDTVQILINGQRRSTLGADGLSISGHLHRR